MPLLTVHQPGQAYLLWQRFSMPTKHGLKDAVAVEPEVADQLISAYTFILEPIVPCVWGITVLILLLICSKIYRQKHSSDKFHSKIYNKRSSRFDTLKTAVEYAIEGKSSPSSWVILARAALWITLALAFVVVEYTVPILFARYIKIDNAAPVNPAAIFLPKPDPIDEFSNLRTYAMSVPWALRAAGSVNEVKNSGSKEYPVSVDDYEVLQVRNDGQKVIRLGYRYQVTGLDFGLQFYPDLILNVEGSCTTDYDWINSSATTNSSGTLVELYLPFNDDSSQQPQRPQNISLFDGGPPLAYFFTGQPGTATNTSWAAIISSANRESRLIGTDPWYLTDETTESGTFRVRAGRPALSCWQNDVWSYLGHNSSVMGLNSTALPGLNLSPGLQTIFASSLGLPMISQLGTYLRTASLKSSFTSLSNIFDASSSSIHEDLERLVWASYIATVNILKETTLYVNNSGIPNILDDNGRLQDGASNFVIYTSEAVALSVRSLIILPTLAVSLWVVFFALMYYSKKAIVSRFPEEKVPETETPGTAGGKHSEVLHVEALETRGEV
jgi:hypothetical protein